jgi:hypothetical protein
LLKRDYDDLQKLNDWLSEPEYHPNLIESLVYLSEQIKAEQI